eukprot:scaffold35231_cov52-Phaeocystis_antarctica.AAC.2
MEEAKNSDKAMCAARVGLGSGSGSGSGRRPCALPVASQSVTATAHAQHVQHDLLPADTARRADHDGPLMTAHGRRTGRPAASCSLCVFLPNSLSVCHLVRWCARQRGCREAAPWAVGGVHAVCGSACGCV